MSKSLFSIPLVRELTAVLIVKLVLIFTIKHFYFSDPVDMSNAEQTVTERFGLAPVAAPEADTSSKNHKIQILNPSKSESPL